MSIAGWTPRSGDHWHHDRENLDDSRHGRPDMGYGDVDDPGSQQAAPASGRPYSSTAREVHNGTTGDAHEGRDGGAEDHSHAIREGPQDGAPDGQCTVGEDHQGSAPDTAVQLTSAVSHTAGDDTTETPLDHASEPEHCSKDDHQAASADNQETDNSTHVARDGAEEAHEAHENEAEHRHGDDAGDACDHHRDDDGEDREDDDDDDVEHHNSGSSTHRGREGGADNPQDGEHDHKDGAHHARGETGDDAAHEACDGSSVIAGDDMLVFKDMSEWGNDDKHVAADEGESHDIGTLLEQCADDDGPTEHGAHAGDHTLDMTHDNVCPPAQGDHGLLIL